MKVYLVPQEQLSGLTMTSHPSPVGWAKCRPMRLGIGTGHGIFCPP